MPKELVMLLDPMAIYFARLPDDERTPELMVFATMLHGSHVRFLRGAWDVDTWEQWAAHAWFDQPVRLMVHARAEAPGLVLRVNVLVPLRDLPEAQWPQPAQGEAWKGARAPHAQDMGPLPLGTLVRYEASFRHRNMAAEAACLLNRALRGLSVEPWEQGARPHAP